MGLLGKRGPELKERVQTEGIWWGVVSLTPPVLQSYEKWRSPQLPLLHRDWSGFIAKATLKGPAPNPLAIGHSITLAVALAIMAAYCPAISGVGTSTHAVAPAERSWS